jgi:hypothetical protein
MFFQVSPAIRQRRLIPIPAAVYKSGFTAGNFEINFKLNGFSNLIFLKATIQSSTLQQWHSETPRTFNRQSS